MLETNLETLDNGKQLRVARLGNGPPLVLLHGYPDNLQIWGKLAPRLADHFEVIAFDWPGMGYSEEWHGGASPFQMADRIVTLLDHWGIRQATLGGLDMGGQPALVCAASHPDRIGGLVVMNSLVLWDEATSWEIALLRKFQLNRLIIRFLPRIVFSRAQRTFLPPGTTLPRDLRRDLWHAFEQPGVRKFVSRMCAGYQGTLPLLPALYSKITCPTLILWGEKEKHFPPAHGERLHGAIKSSRFEIVQGAEHWMVWHLADKVAASLIRFGVETSIDLRV